MDALDWSAAVADREKCSPVHGPVNDAVLFVGNFATVTFYHWVIDNVFMSWVTLGQVAMDAGCPATDIPVYAINAHRGKRPIERGYIGYETIWQMVFGSDRYAGASRGTDAIGECTTAR